MRPVTDQARGPQGLRILLRRIRSHDEYSVWIHAAIINSHICMEISFATSASVGK